MPSRQPVWRFLANLGDRNPLEYGGFFVYEDRTGQYEPEAVVLDPPGDEDDKNAKYTEYRFSLDRLKRVGTYLVPWDWAETWGGKILEERGPFEWTPDEDPEKIQKAQRYDVWFHKHLPQVANSGEIDLKELEDNFTSEDPLVRARAYGDIGYAFGFEELDQYPLEHTKSEVKKRFRNELKRSAEM